jgi:hypothetical protein
MGKVNESSYFATFIETFGRDLIVLTLTASAPCDVIPTAGSRELTQVTADVGRKTN